MGMIDLFDGFHREAIQQGYPPSARVLFDTFIYKFCAEARIDKLVFSERELTQLTGLKKTTLHEAKHFLTSRHLIECGKFKGKTVYKLGDQMAQLLWKENASDCYQPTADRPPTDQQATSRRPVGDQPSRLGSLSSSHRYLTDYPPRDVETISSSSSSSSSPPSSSTTRARDSPEIDDLIEYWEKSNFGRLDFEMISELQILLDRHGYETLRETMKDAKFSNGKAQGVSFKFFKKVLDNKVNAKGGKKRERNDAAERCTPQRGFNPILGYDPNSD